jgi:hypothetical protein
MADREPLTDEQKQAIAEACVCDPHGWVPRPENLPLAEKLRERGTFTRTMECGRAVYRPSDEFKRAATMHAAMFGAGVSQN